MVRSLPHNPAIVVDVYEADTLIPMLSKYLTVVRMNLVPLGLADFFWVGADGTRFTFEHKTVEQALSEAGNRLDDQLRKHTQNADVTGLIIDGITTPTEDGKGSYIWSPVAKNPKILVRRRKHPKSFLALVGYFASLYMDNIRVMYGYPDTETMCRALVEMVYHSVTDPNSHKTLRRYVKTRPVMWRPDPMVATLMGIAGAGVGEITAQKILKVHGTPYNFFLSNLVDNKDVGEAVYRKVMGAIGRRV